MAEPLPIPVYQENDTTPEELRLKYRFLDLRKDKLHKNIMLRSQVIASLRRRMIAQGFTEFQTPILTADSPEGARSYLVPSRLHPGKFYALPQAPQMFKQLLMVSGFDRYFQIAPCFRDEDARADRAPGEFYQLDFEMSFVTQEDVFAAIEPVLHGVFEEFGNGRAVTSAPFPRITFAEAALKYGTDKPDLRNPLVIADVSEVFAASKFRAFKRNEESGQIEFSHNPFSRPQGGLEALETRDPLSILAYQYDIVCSGIELSSGAIRNLRPDIMIKAFEIAGYSAAEVEARFGGML